LRLPCLPGMRDGSADDARCGIGICGDSDGPKFHLDYRKWLGKFDLLRGVAATDAVSLARGQCDAIPRGLVK
jgi:hypothetical protein